jgi:predicted  nucleic acid-binding Zn-ribbon protein
MNPTIEALLILQARDLRVAELTDAQEEAPRQIAAIERELAAKTAQFAELKNRTRQVEADRKKLDLEVKTREAAIVRYKAQQLATRKNEEFAALIHEIEHAQAEISKLEDSELELMEAYEKGLADVAAGEKELAQADAKAKEKKAALQKRGEAAAAELKTAVVQQADAEQKVPEEVLSRYRRILKSKGDKAVVLVEHGSCTGCHMKLTTQTANSARREDLLAACDNCGRLLYAE